MLLRHIPGPSSGLRAASLLFKANPASPSAAAAAAAFTPFAQGRRPLVTRSPAFSPTTPALFSTSSFRSRPSSADSEADVQCPLLEPPWQLTDLKRHEQEAWKKHGTAMFEEVPMQHYARQSLERIELRRAAAKRLEQEHGPNWYVLSLLCTGSLVSRFLVFSFSLSSSSHLPLPSCFSLFLAPRNDKPDGR